MNPELANPVKQASEKLKYQDKFDAPPRQIAPAVTAPTKRIVVAGKSTPGKIPVWGYVVGGIVLLAAAARLIFPKLFKRKRR